MISSWVFTMPSIVNYRFSKLALIFEVGPMLWTILGLASTLTLGVEKSSTLDDDRLSSILADTSWDSWIVLGYLSLRRYPIYPVNDLV
jgi:hypothetical protein